MGSEKEVVLPDCYIGNGMHKLYSIYDKAFYGCININRVTIGRGVIGIGKFAFDASGLTNVVFKVTDGWSVKDYSGTKTQLSSDALADPVTAAEYLRAKYYNFSWTRE